eukprot:1819353-Prymnesium_polylepis.1
MDQLAQFSTELWSPSHPTVKALSAFLNTDYSFMRVFPEFSSGVRRPARPSRGSDNVWSGLQENPTFDAEARAFLDDAVRSFDRMLHLLRAAAVSRPVGARSHAQVRRSRRGARAPHAAEARPAAQALLRPAQLPLQGKAATAPLAAVPARQAPPGVHAPAGGREKPVARRSDRLTLRFNMNGRG